MARVIHFKNLPSRPPIWVAIQAWIGLKVIDHPGWITGMVWTIVSLFVIAWIVGTVKEEQVDIFKDKP